MTDGRQRRARTWFFANSALVMLALVLASFSFTYFWPMAMRTRSFSLVLHLHGAAYFAWMLLYAWQTRLVAQNKVARHREWGWPGSRCRL